MRPSTNIRVNRDEDEEWRFLETKAKPDPMERSELHFDFVQLISRETNYLWADK